MGHCFMFQNLIDDETVITATSVEKGFVGAGVPRVAGAGGSMIFSGAYTGEDQEVYFAEIDTPGDVGSARFRWRKTSTPTSGWEASNIPTALTDIPLDSGVKIRFVDGVDSPAFAVGDHWQATANRFYSPRRIYDLDPATRVRSGSPPEDPWSLALDFGAQISPDVFIAHLHNFPPGANLRIQANKSADWRAPALDEKLTWAQRHAHPLFRHLHRAHIATGAFWPKAPPPTRMPVWKSRKSIWAVFSSPPTISGSVTWWEKNPSRKGDAPKIWRSGRCS